MIKNFASYDQAELGALILARTRAEGHVGGFRTHETQVANDIRYDERMDRAEKLMAVMQDGIPRSTREMCEASGLEESMLRQAVRYLMNEGKLSNHIDRNGRVRRMIWASTKVGE